MRSRQLLVELLSLHTARARVLLFGSLTALIYLSQYHWLDHLSLWGHLGVHSPSIGLTRAYWLLLHGQPTAAWHRNPLIYLVLTVGLPLLVIDVVSLIRVRPRLPASPQSMV